QMNVSGRKVQLSVYGIHEEAGHRWIQLGLENQPMHMLTVHIGGADGFQRVATSVGAWVADSIRNGSLREVAYTEGGTRTKGGGSKWFESPPLVFVERSGAYSVFRRRRRAAKSPAPSRTIVVGSGTAADS